VDIMKNKRLDEHSSNLIILIVFASALFILDKIFGESLKEFFYALLPTLVLIIFYILIHRRTTVFEDSVKELLETHIPDIVYLDNSDTIKAEFLEAVNGAEKYIITTGGKSRIKEYLSAIEKNLEENEIEYYRIISGEKISNELYEHLSKIIGREGVYVSYTLHHLPTLLLTEKICFMGFPDPKPDEFRVCLKIPHEKIIEKLGRYTRIWHSQSETLKNKEGLEKIKRY